MKGVAAPLHDRWHDRQLRLLGGRGRDAFPRHRSPTRRPATTCSIRRAPRDGPKASCRWSSRSRSTSTIRCWRSPASSTASIADTIYLSPAPLYHAAPLRFNMSVMRLGGTSIIMENFDAEEYPEADAQIPDHAHPGRADHVRALPQAARRGAREARHVSSLKCAIHAAAPCPIPTKEAMIKWWGPIIWEYYGGTEGNGLTMCNAQEWMAHKGTVGRADRRQAQDLRRRRATSCRPANPAPCISPRAGRSSITTTRRRPQESRHPQGMEHPGRRRLSSTADGFLHLTDRKAFMIISGGVNIYPQECENLLINHPKVIDCAVFGVPNADFGEEVKAVVQPQPHGRGGPGTRRGADRLLQAAPLGDQVSAQRRLRSPNCRAIRPASSTSACCATATGKAWHEQDRLGIARNCRVDAAAYASARRRLPPRHRPASRRSW
jgi:hypothetical protein